MSRLNLTLPEVTMKALNRYAKGRPAASAARELIEEGLARLARAHKLRQLAHDYAAGRDDARELLADYEPLARKVVGHERD